MPANFTSANTLTPSGNTSVIQISDASYCAATRELSIGGARKALEPRLGDLLTRLAQAGGPVSRDDLLDDVWGDEGSDEALTQAISKLRRALGDNDRPYAIIQTVPKFGYRLDLKPEISPSSEKLPPQAPIPFSHRAINIMERHRVFLSGFAAGLALASVIGLLFVALNPPRTIEREIVCSEGADSVECNALLAAIED